MKHLRSAIEAVIGSANGSVIRSAVAVSLLIPCALVLLMASACSDKTAPPATYTVRGVVEELPTPESRNNMMVQHEALPEFVHRDGKRRGMDAMTMPFGVAKGLGLDGIAKGDKIEFTLEVKWDRNPPGYITAIRKLPADTALQL